MLLHAISIFQKKKSTATLNSLFKKEAEFECTLSAGENLKQFQKKLLPVIDKGMENTYASLHRDKEGFYYFKRDIEIDNQRKLQTDTIIVIQSRKEISPKELGYLFLNIHHIHTRPLSVKHTLENVITNPLGYINRDILIDNAKQQVNELMEEVLRIEAQLLKRGELLESLQETSSLLETASLEFKDKSRDLNKRCCLIL